MAKRVHWACRELRISHLLRDQLFRASASVALNLAEGSGKRTPKEQARFYGIALGSLRECEAVLELERIEDPELLQLINGLGSMLFSLSRRPARDAFAIPKTGRKRKRKRQRKQALALGRSLSSGLAQLHPMLLPQFRQR